MIRSWWARARDRLRRPLTENCRAVSRPMPIAGYLCTEPKGHAGQHCARITDGSVAATWSDVPRASRGEGV